MLRYRFGNTSLRFECSDPTWLSYLEERYSSFEDPTPDNVFSVRFECTRPEAPVRLTSPLSTYVEAPMIEGHEFGFTAETSTTFADVDLRARRARLFGPRALYPVDNLFRHLLPSLGEQGALFHGAALADGERGVLACGPSGAGKSTLAKLAGSHALCDELASVLGSDRGYRLTSLPFWRARPGSVDLRAVLLLRHGSENRVDAVPPADAFRRLTRQVLWPIEIPGSMESTLGQVAGLVERVPVHELSFRAEPSAWRFIEEQFLS